MTPQAKTIVTECAAEHGIDKSALMDCKFAAPARKKVWYLLRARNPLAYSYQRIGRDFGRHHTTIMHGVKKIKMLIRKDTATARHMHALKQQLGVR